MAELSKLLRSASDGSLLFWCPGCDGPHRVTVGDGPGPRWGYNGNADAPTFTPSVFVNAPGQYFTPSVPSCHSFVTDGQIHFLADCTHELAGQTVAIPDFEAEFHVG